MMMPIKHGGRRPGAGRPKGVPNKLTRPVKELAAQYSPDALRTLVEIMQTGESEQARIAAAKELLDRGHGKPRPEPDTPRVRVIIRDDVRAVAWTPPSVESQATDPDHV